MANNQTGEYTFFFYGTLMHPPILYRVLGKSPEKSELISRPALLSSHVRHNVQGCDYPAIVPVEYSEKEIVKRRLDEEEKGVRGTLISGFTKMESMMLDWFEGSEYSRAPVEVIPLEAPTDPVSALTYVWVDSPSKLSRYLWSYEQFLREKVWRWVGKDNSEYEDVDNAAKEAREEADRNARGGRTVPPATSSREAQLATPIKPFWGATPDNLFTPGWLPHRNGLESFGRGFRDKYWQFEDGYIPLNHGSYGACPMPVLEQFHELQRRAEAAPDRWFRSEYVHWVNTLRGRIASMVNCDEKDLVIVQNASAGVNTVLRSLPYQRRDKLLFISPSIYNSCLATLRFIVDSNPLLNLELCPVYVDYPIDNADLIKKVEDAIAQHHCKDPEDVPGGGRIGLALVDSISSNPGVVVPYQEITKILKKHGIRTLIDGAHSIGQLPIDLRDLDADFFVSNLHKWAYGHRGVAFLYVRKEFQSLVHSLPISHAYKSPSLKPATPSPLKTTTDSDFVSEFEWVGSIDWSPIISAHAALDFRHEICGGEKRINEYCHQLALDGGDRMAEVFGGGSVVMQNKEKTLIANMANVSLPLPLPEDEEKQLQQRDRMYNYMFEKKVFVPCFPHAGKWWLRSSAQCYNDITDFEKTAVVLKEICKELNQG